MKGCLQVFAGIPYFYTFFKQIPNKLSAKNVYLCSRKSGKKKNNDI